ncbi:hypothetical protein WN51_01746 [Melipona quadrifasciata]|uniref:Uncharacterized protein n=1 Tax=Melipona quadrifasciata TaxID=166423 RepID=A0A0N0U4N6_9HYME|nr:hypothetical protein WN51_01746 [Melipona quadrifasciata]
MPCDGQNPNCDRRRELLAQLKCLISSMEKKKACEWDEPPCPPPVICSALCTSNGFDCCKNKIETKESSDEEVVSFTRRIINRISSNSDSDDEESYASEDLEEMLEELAIAEEEELNNDGDSLDNIQWNKFANKFAIIYIHQKKWASDGIAFQH